VRLTIETNTLTASVAIASFVLYVAFPDNIYYTFTAGIIGKLYSNTLLVSLNNRIYFRDHSYPGGNGNTQCYIDSSRSYPSAVSSLTFAHPGLHSHTASIGDNLRHGVIPSAKVIKIEKSAVVEESIDTSHVWYWQCSDLRGHLTRKQAPAADRSSFFSGWVQCRTPDFCCIVVLASWEALT